MKLLIDSHQGKLLPGFLQQAHELVVSTRKKASTKKPETFLIAVYPDNSRRYVSSLYPIGEEGAFKFDYQGQSYRLNLASSTADSQQISITTF